MAIANTNLHNGNPILFTSKTSTNSSTSEYRVWEASGIDQHITPCTPENVYQSMSLEEGNVQEPREMMRSPRGCAININNPKQLEHQFN